MIHLPTCIIRLNVPFIGLNSLKRLRLQDNLIQQLPQEALSDLEALEQLSLRKNHLSTIPPKLLSHLIHLKHLDLSNNWISSVLVLTSEISTSRIVSLLQIAQNYSNRWPVKFWSHLLTHSSLTHLEVSWMVTPGFFYLLVCSFLVFLVMYYRAFCWYVATSFFHIPSILSNI
jgi:hypothetical protein